MLKTRLILIAVTAVVIWLLFLLPKVVVENESQLASTQDSVQTKNAGGHVAVPETLSESIKSLRSQYLRTPQNEKIISLPTL